MQRLILVLFQKNYQHQEVSASATQVTEALATTRADTEEMSAINENLIEAISFFTME